jgi:small redox-active disulfide protein 2
MDGLLAGSAAALWLGILTSISPCPLATNVAAMSFIGKDLGSPTRVMLTGALYTIGRSVAYAGLAWLLIASLFAIHDVSFFLQRYMNKALGPILILTGILLLDVIPISFTTSCVTDGIEKRLRASGLAGAGLLGIRPLVLPGLGGVVFWEPDSPRRSTRLRGHAALGVRDWDGSASLRVRRADRTRVAMGRQGVQPAGATREVGAEDYGCCLHRDRRQVWSELHLWGSNMKIQIAGPGCMNCKTTEQRVFNVCAELNLAADISKVTDYNEMAKLGVLRTPAVVIDGEIAIMGRVPSVAELKTLLGAQTAG